MDYLDRVPNEDVANIAETRTEYEQWQDAVVEQDNRETLVIQVPVTIFTTASTVNAQRDTTLASLEYPNVVETCSLGYPMD